MTITKQVDAKREQAMYIERKNSRPSEKNCLIMTLILLCLVLAGCGGLGGHSKQIGFTSDEEAVNAFVKAMREDKKDELIKVLGQEGKKLIWSGDEIDDQQRFEIFLSAYDEQHKIISEENDKILVVGRNDWPFPIPIVNVDGQWIFDTARGKEEILNRRIGRNELETIQVMLAIVDAQREYAMKDREGDGLLKYAQKFKSDPGKKNGLYWETKEGEEPSPLGPFAAKARKEGYLEKESSDEPQPYHGYYYRILTTQGANAPGGEFDYIVNGKMVGGFAVVAYPADYGNSGVMTFIVNHDGVVYQKDLGEDTEKEAQAMKLFDPDKTWKKAE